MGRAAATPPPVDPPVEPTPDAEREVTFLVVSHDAQVGAKRTVSAKKAASLVKRRLARYSDE